MVSSSDLHYSANADDAQIATAVRLAGLRSIQDPDLKFTDQMPLKAKGQRRQKPVEHKGSFVYLPESEITGFLRETVDLRRYCGEMPGCTFFRLWQ